MKDTVGKALTHWGLGDAACALAAARENHVYRVDHNGCSFALRLHRAGYRTDAELWSELEWMGALADGGLHVPAPIRSSAGHYIEVIDGVQFDLLTWLPGAPIGATGGQLEVDDRQGLFSRLGHEMARLHSLSDAWSPPEGFTRCRWDRDGLVGQMPLWGQFWKNPTLTAQDRALFERARQQADARLKQIEGTLDFGLIHADLVRENVMADGDTLQFIDFDDSGFGFRVFDIATALIKNLREPDYPDLRDALMDGYQSHRSIDCSALDLFLLLRAFTYVGWIIPRMNEEGGEARNTRFVSTARILAERFLAENIQIAP